MSLGHMCVVLVDSKAPHAPIEVSSIRCQFSGGLRHVAVGLGDGFANQIRFELL